MTGRTCLIWGTPAEVQQQAGSDYVRVMSPRAGGEYRVPHNVELFGLSAEDKVKLTAWLVERRWSGDYSPLITPGAFTSARNARDLSVLERRDRLLDWLAFRSPTLGTQITISGVDDEKLLSLQGEMQLVTQSGTDQEVYTLLNFLREDGLINTSPSHLSITFKGWSYLEKQRAEQVATEQAFVAMWFHKSTEAAFLQGIEPAIRDTGYRPLRIDQKEHVNKIDDEIVAEIRRSRFIVADFTSEIDKPRGGVYFEAGFAFGLNKPVIWTCREDLIGNVHFDTRQFNHITWNSPEDLYTKLKNRIGAVLGQGPLLT